MRSTRRKPARAGVSEGWLGTRVGHPRNVARSTKTPGYLTSICEVEAYGTKSISLGRVYLWSLRIVGIRYRDRRKRL